MRPQCVSAMGMSMSKSFWALASLKATSESQMAGARERIEHNERDERKKDMDQRTADLDTSFNEAIDRNTTTAPVARKAGRGNEENHASMHHCSLNRNETTSSCSSPRD